MECVNASRAVRTSPASPCAAASAPPIEWRASSDVRRASRRPRAADAADWRAAVTEAAAPFRTTALRHRWLSSVLGQAGHAYLGPNLMSFSERLAALFTAVGFPEPSGAIDAVLSYTIGMSTTEAAWLTTVARSGESEGEFIARLMPAAQQAAAGHAHLAGSYAESAATSTDPVAPRDGKFAYGLDVVLDGLSLRLARQTPSARSASPGTPRPAPATPFHRWRVARPEEVVAGVERAGPAWTRWPRR
ncbi:TetR/AcrR family transcriptional regulator C-terminal domain-containing protein [Streptomyces sp. NPDC048504]|uniref:TetR/AcrR family transcriptional regulator C-terminal domain-containing protein n=1 Tax=Streptomyces sp. NPDC048504 TaxID=3365559 RepID=UPI00371572F8